MSRRDLLLACSVAVLWGLSFVVVKWGLADLPPLLFASLRFGVIAAFAPLVARPRISPAMQVAHGLAWGSLQFGGLFLAIALGLPAGTTSIVAQSQVLFTLSISLLFRQERARVSHAITIGFALAGLLLIGANGASSLPAAGFVAAVLASLGWAFGNIIVRRLANDRVAVDGPAFLAWGSVVPALSLFVLSLAVEGPAQIPAFVSRFSPRAGAALLYQSFISLTLGNLLWNRLLRKYAPSNVAPFSLLVPVVGLTAGYLAFGETMSARQYVGSGLLLAGLASNVLAARSGRIPRDGTAAVAPSAS